MEIVFLVKRKMNRYIFMLKRAIWNVNSGLILRNLRFTVALEYNLTPQAKREIRKIVYEHFDYIVAEWNKYFK